MVHIEEGVSHIEERVYVYHISSDQQVAFAQMEARLHVTILEANSDDTVAQRLVHASSMSEPQMIRAVHNVKKVELCISIRA
jgi:hypothetical protein